MKRLIFCGVFLGCALALAGCSSGLRSAQDTRNAAYQIIDIPAEGIVVKSYDGLPPPVPCRSAFCRDQEGQAE